MYSKIKMAEAFLHNLLGETLDKTFILNTCTEKVEVELTFGQGIGPHVILEMIEETHLAFHERAFTIEGIIDNDDKIAIPWRAHAKHIGLYKDFAPSYETINYRGMSFIKIKNGKIEKILSTSNFLQILYEKHDLLMHSEEYFAHDIPSSLLIEKMIHNLTKRELQVLSLWVTGMSLKQSATWLGGISSRTIEAHRENIKYKLKVKSRNKLFELLHRSQIINTLIKESQFILNPHWS